MNDAVLKKLSRPMLFAATLIWGSSFVVLKNTLDSVPVFLLLAVRFLVAAALLAVVFHGRLAGLGKDCVFYGAVMGLLLLAAYCVQTFGLAGTTPGKNAFLTAVYCVIVPFFSWAVTRVRPDKYNLAAALLCIAGIGLVSLSGDLTMTPGDALTLLSGFFYAAHIVCVSRFSKRHDIITLTVLQFAVTGAGALLLALLFERPLTIPLQAAPGLAYLSVVSTALALLFQNIGQKYTEPAAASVLLSLEAPFGVLFSLLFYGELPTGRMLAGFALIFAAVICSETKLEFLRITEKAGEEV